MTTRRPIRTDEARDVGQDQVEALLSLLSTRRVGEDVYRAEVLKDDLLTQTYGGQLVAQALAAAGHTVRPGCSPQSLHAYFVRPGQLGRPLQIAVERVRDGRSFATRRVTSSQGGSTVLVLNASFHVREPGEDYQIPPPSDVPGPGVAPRVDDVGSPLFAAFDVREITPGEVGNGASRGEPVSRLWVRTRGPLPDDPLVHSSVLAYISDLRPVIAAHVPIDVPFGAGTFSSLDHAMWFHRPVRMDDWVLIDYHVVSNAGSRGLVHGLVYTEGGTLVASFNQEVLLRTGPRTGRAASAHAAAD